MYIYIYLYIYIHIYTYILDIMISRVSQFQVLASQNLLQARSPDPRGGTLRRVVAGERVCERLNSIGSIRLSQFDSTGLI